MISIRLFSTFLLGFGFACISLRATCLELAGIEIPKCVQGRGFVPMLKDPSAVVREIDFSEQHWHVYKNHSRTVRFGDFVYIKNDFPNQTNLSYESDTTFPAGRELWEAHLDGKTTIKLQQVFANPCPSEELFQISTDAEQFSNLAKNPEYEDVLVKARYLLRQWTKETGETIPENPIPKRHAPPQVIDGELVPAPEYQIRNPDAEMPGAVKNATIVNHPGPIQFSKI